MLQRFAYFTELLTHTLKLLIRSYVIRKVDVKHLVAFRMVNKTTTSVISILIQYLFFGVYEGTFQG